MCAFMGHNLRHNLMGHNLRSVYTTINLNYKLLFYSY